MATTQIHADYIASSKLAQYPFEPYWPEKPLRICVTGAGGFIASHLAKRLKSEGHYIVAADWKRNEHMNVSRNPGVDISSI
jgi:GDP-D-mannose 3', 5'-epimerase